MRSSSALQPEPPSATPEFTAASGQAGLRPRIPHSAQKRRYATSDLQHAWKNRVQVKFREGSGVRARAGKLSLESSKVMEGSPPAGELSSVAATLAVLGDYVAVRTAPFPEDAMDELRETGQKLARKELADLNLWYYVYANTDSADSLATLLNNLNSLALVEIAEPTMKGIAASMPAGELLPVPSASEVAKKETVSAGGVSYLPRRPVTVAEPENEATPSTRTLTNFTSGQHYWDAAPTGMDVQWLRSRYSYNLGQGQAIGIIDAEWDEDHREFTTLPHPPNLVTLPGHTEPAPLPTFPWYSLGDFDHGTATLGIIASTPYDLLGTSGILPRADMFVLASWTGNPDQPGNILAMLPVLYLGSVVDLEYGLEVSFDCNGHGHVNSDDQMPLEYDSDVLDAIQYMTAYDVSVVEAAGNGNCNLDNVPRLNVNHLAFVDSGAVVVASSERTSRAKYLNSNYGSRIDVNAEGNKLVVTAGYGEKHPGGTDPPLSQVHEWYTGVWSDTSAAAAQVAAALAHLNAIVTSYHGSYLSSATIREIARQSGTPYAGSYEIGRRPDLKKQVARTENFFLHTSSTKYVGGASAPGPDYMNWDQGTGLWTVKDPVNGNSTSFVFGSPGQIPVVADFSWLNGSLADVVVYDPPTGRWLTQGGGVMATMPGFGLPIPLECNSSQYGRELAVFRPYATSASNNPNGKCEWSVRCGYNFGYWITQTVEWGDGYVIPLVGDFISDSEDDLVAVKPSWTPGGLSVWSILASPYNPSLSPKTQFSFGQWNDIYLTCKVPNPSGKSTRAAVYRPNDGRFIVRVPEAPTGTISSEAFGKPGDVPVCMDVDQNGTDDFVLWRPGERRWYRNNATSWTYVSTATEDSYAIAR